MGSAGRWCARRSSRTRTEREYTSQNRLSGVLFLRFESAAGLGCNEAGSRPARRSSREFSRIQRGFYRPHGAARPLLLARASPIEAAHGFFSRALRPPCGGVGIRGLWVARGRNSEYGPLRVIAP